jgi:TRAP-type C4-dicarboxylate transport system substrate-binding protein
VKAWMPRNTVIVNKAIWDKLSDKNKAVFTDCASKAEAAGLQKSKDANSAALEALAKNGMRVVQPSDQLASDMAKIGETMTNEWVAKAGDAGKAVIEEFKK